MSFSVWNSHIWTADERMKMWIIVAVMKESEARFQDLIFASRLTTYSFFSLILRTLLPSSYQPSEGHISLIIRIQFIPRDLCCSVKVRGCLVKIRIPYSWNSGETGTNEGLWDFCKAGRSQMLYFSLFSKPAIIARVNCVSSKITFFSTIDYRCHL